MVVLYVNLKSILYTKARYKENISLQWIPSVFYVMSNIKMHYGSCVRFNVLCGSSGMQKRHERVSNVVYECFKGNGW